MNYFTPKSLFRNPSRRLVTKSGSTNIKCVNIEKQYFHYLADFFTTLLELQWRWIVLIFLSGFIVSWFLFTILWYGLVTWHGDLDHVMDDTWTPCVWNIHNFLSVLLFSIETQTTIGYGYRYVSEKCEVGVLLMVLQSMMGAMLQAMLAGTLLARIQIPKSRRKTVCFSKRACVSLIDTDLCLMFRVGNLRSSEVVGAQVRAIFVRQRYTAEGHLLPHHTQDLKIGFEESGTRMHLWWPTTIVHVIDEQSPFWRLTPSGLQECKFEIILILEGSIASTSLSFQGRTSYLPGEIDWGYRFQPMFHSRDPKSRYDVNFESFNVIYPTPWTPRMSAKDWKVLHDDRLRKRRVLYSLSE